VTARFICGLQPVREAIAAHGAALERVLVENSDSPQLAAVARFATDRGAKVERMSRANLDKLARGARHQGAIAFAPALRILDLNELELGASTLLVILDEIEDPQNFGAVVRSAVAMGATAVVFPEHHAAPLTAATFRASAGAVEHATLCRIGGVPSAIETLKRQGVHCVGLDTGGDTLLADVDLAQKTALILGAEGKGLRKSVKAACNVLARLPMTNTIASLNVSAAAAMALYEVRRQRTR
jgi:23S rRNA (guanosine2251-2'-O)-methyltransferase